MFGGKLGSFGPEPKKNKPVEEGKHGADYFVQHIVNKRDVKGGGPEAEALDLTLESFEDNALFLVVDIDHTILCRASDGKGTHVLQYRIPRATEDESDMVETVLREEIVIAPGAIKFLKKMSAKWRIFLLTAGADMRTKEVDALLKSLGVPVCGSGSCRDETGKKQKKTLSMLNLRKELSIVLDDSPEAWDIPFQEHVFGVPEFIPRCEVKEEEPCDLCGPCRRRKIVESVGFNHEQIFDRLYIVLEDLRARFYERTKVDRAERPNLAFHKKDRFAEYMGKLITDTKRELFLRGLLSLPLE